ncbi:hypothetical protein EN41_25420 [Agrobacterium tumefaciens]|nr:hypothetical protein EN41_25420 [Agrobacterium tumefaciens]
MRNHYRPGEQLKIQVIKHAMSPFLSDKSRQVSSDARDTFYRKASTNTLGTKMTMLPRDILNLYEIPNVNI